MNDIQFVEAARHFGERLIQNGITPEQRIDFGFRAVTSTVMDGSFHVTLAAGKRWIAGGLKGSVVSNLVTWVWSGSAFVVPSAMAKTALHAMTHALGSMLVPLYLLMRDDLRRSGVKEIDQYLWEV